MIQHHRLQSYTCIVRINSTELPGIYFRRSMTASVICLQTIAPTRFVSQKKKKSNLTSTSTLNKTENKKQIRKTNDS